MVEIIRLTLRPPDGLDDRLSPRTVWDQHGLEAIGDPPPEGFASWDEYFSFIEFERRRMTTFASPGTVPRGRKASMVWTRAGEDVATIGMHFLHADGSAAVDFTDADEATINARLLTLWNAITADYTSALALDRLVWHAWGVGVRRPNPATNEYAVSPAVAGGDDPDTQLPPQVAASVTLKTSVRKQWGRVYLPPPSNGHVVAGRFAAGFMTSVRNAFGDLLDGASGDGLPLVIWSPRHDGGPLKYGDGTPDGRAAAHAAGLDNPDSSSFARSVLQVQVDDVVDTIRSRRFSKALVRDTHTL